MIGYYKPIAYKYFSGVTYIVKMWTMISKGWLAYTSFDGNSFTQCDIAVY